MRSLILTWSTIATLATDGVLGIQVKTDEVIVPLPSGGGSLALSTRGSSAFRVRFLTSGAEAPIETPMVAPQGPDATFTKTGPSASGTGIQAASLGQVLVSPKSELVLLAADGKELTRSAPIGGAPSNDTCASQPGTDITGGTRAGDPSTVADEGACCEYCKGTAGCHYWIYGNPGDVEGNCWVLGDIEGTTPSADRTLGGAGTGRGLHLSARPSSKLYGGGASLGDTTLTVNGAVSPLVDNTKVYTPYYYSDDGYGCLGVVPESTTTGQGKTNVFPAAFTKSVDAVSWSRPDGAAFELYLMPAATLDAGTAAYYGLIGTAVMPPRYAFGFIASRWGWEDRSYIESTLQQFRDGAYPLDAIIGDFGWFTNVSDYSFPPVRAPRAPTESRRWLPAACLHAWQSGPVPPHRAAHVSSFAHAHALALRLRGPSLPESLLCLV